MRALGAAALVLLVLTSCGTDGAGPAAPATTTAPSVGTPPSTPPAEPDGIIESRDPPPAGTIPAGALLSVRDLGAGWSAAAPHEPSCAPTLTVTRRQSRGFREARGQLTEVLTLGSEVGPAVASWRRALEACGFAVSDLPLGEAGLTARAADGRAALLVTGTEGVVVVLHASGGLAGAGEELESWADLAMGTSCVAAHDGCH